MRLYSLLTLLSLCCCASSAFGQMSNGSDTLYGNEWIDYTKTYYKIKVVDDGVYRIPATTLQAAGVPIASIPTAQYRLYRYGRQEPLFVSAEPTLGSQDFIEFYGEKNRGELDRHLFDNPNTEQVNPWYSMFNDTTAYYLTWETTGTPLRYAAITNDLTNLPPKEVYCWYTERQVFTAAHVKRRISTEALNSWFDGDGWGSEAALVNSASFTPLAAFTSGPAGRMNIRYAVNIGSHKQRIFVNDSLRSEKIFFGFRVVQDTMLIQPSDFRKPITVKIQGVQNEQDRNILAGIEFNYPRSFQFNNARFEQFSLSASAASRYLELQPFSSGGEPPVVFDLTNRIRIEAISADGVFKMKLPIAAGNRRIAVVAPRGGIKEVSSLIPIKFTDYRNLKADYLMIAGPRMLNGSDDAVAEYSNYRRSTTGGAYNVAVVRVEDLYEQYGYGVRFHPLSIRNFVQYISKHWPLRHTLLAGKSMEYPLFRTSAAQRSEYGVTFFVPSFGYWGADMPFTMPSNRIVRPVSTIGRLAVINGQEMSGYLKKVKEHENYLTNAQQTPEDKSWMKRVMHISGGNSGETAIIRNNSADMANILRNNKFGADIRTFYKTSDDPIQESGFEQLLDLVNSGISLWMIYGHSNSQFIDFNIGQPNTYNNKGRYPFMMLLGCNSGYCSGKLRSIGERYTLIPNKGTIAYVATVSWGYIDVLHTYGKQYYQRLGGTDYGKTIGEVMQNTVGDFEKGSRRLFLDALLHQNVLQGDPAIRLYPHAGPDFLVDNQNVTLTPNPVGLDEKSLKVEFDIVNLGSNTGKKLRLDILQQLPDRSTLTRLTDTVAAPGNRGRFSYNIPTRGSKVGFNRILIRLDGDNAIREEPATAEANNELMSSDGQSGVPVYFFANDIQPVGPSDFAIVNRQTTALYASTLNTDAGVSRYLFEFDTMHTFSSPFLKKTSFVSKGGLLTWTPPFMPEHGKAYYWRVARDTLLNGQNAWRTRSFVYLNQRPESGWNQSHKGQYSSNRLLNFGLNNSKLQFANNANSIVMKVAYRHPIGNPSLQTSLYEGWNRDNAFNLEGAIGGGVVFALIDPQTGRLVENPVNGPYNYDKRPNLKLFWFATREADQRLQMMNFLEKGIPDNYYVAMLAFNTPTDTLGYAPQLWARDSLSSGRNIFQILEKKGARKARQLEVFNTSPYPYGFIFRQNDPSYAAIDTFVTNIDSVAVISADYFTKWSVGSMECATVGPAKSWGRLDWKVKEKPEVSDRIALRLWGVRQDESDTLIMTSLQPADTSLTFISAVKFPYLRLQFDATDLVNQTVVQPDYFRVFYTPRPEGALDPTAYAIFDHDTLNQGEMLRTGWAFRNISDVPMDSLLVRLSIESADGTRIDMNKRYKNLANSDTVHVNFKVPTIQLTGPQRAVLEVNPDQDQPEQFTFNNVSLRDFFVLKDQRPPLLDITFDGNHILDGDLISPKPSVVISLSDDNRYLAIRDTGAFRMMLSYPDGKTRTLYFNDPSINFIPAEEAGLNKKNQARIEWRPEFTLDGIYRLMVNGRDVSGNSSSSVDYSITFNIVTKSSFSNVLTYPNPFSTSACFIYTLTGVEKPARFKIQILTVGGKIVREITESEFGLLQTGTHRSDYCWDGKDEYGDQLANGVYLYRIVAKKADGSDFELFENAAADGYFKHSYGKMVLMR